MYALGWRRHIPVNSSSVAADSGATSPDLHQQPLTRYDVQPSSPNNIFLKRRFDFSKLPHSHSTDKAAVAAGSELATPLDVSRDDQAGTTGQLNWFAIITVAWIAGVLLLFLRNLFSTWRCLRAIAGSPVEPSKELLQLFDKTRTQLGIARAINLRISDSPLGPAVIGLWNPMVVIPNRLVAKLSRADLRVIFAHELTHITRRDLWFSGFQTLVQMFWWFHPLVWLANRLATREIERCCDEQAIAGLQISPAVYARGLVRVLEHKHLLKPAAAFPGVRPIDLTSQRLERIMSLRQGCRRQVPRTCWLIALLLAFVVLPGASNASAIKSTGAQQAQAQEPASQPLVQEGQSNAESGTALPLLTEEWVAQPAGERKPENLILRTYQLPDLVADIRDEHEIDIEAARKEVQTRVMRLSVPQPSFNHAMEQASSPFTGEYAWMEDKMIVSHDEAGHDRIAKVIERLREFGLRTIVTSTVIMSCDDETLAKLGPAWNSTLATSEDRFANLDIDSSETRDHLLASSGTRQSIKYFLEKIDNERRREEVESLIRSSTTSNIQQLPTISQFMGTSSKLTFGSEVPFANIVNGRPIVEVAFHGTRIGYFFVLEPDNQLRFHYDIEHSVIDSVDDLTTAEGANIQTPNIKSSLFKGLSTIEPGQTLMLGGLKDPEDPEKTLIHLFEVRLVEEESMLLSMIPTISKTVEAAGNEILPQPLPQSGLPTSEMLPEGSTLPPASSGSSTNGKEPQEQLKALNFDMSFLTKQEQLKTINFDMSFLTKIDRSIRDLLSTQINSDPDDNILSDEPREQLQCLIDYMVQYSSWPDDGSVTIADDHILTITQTTATLRKMMLDMIHLRLELGVWHEIEMAVIELPESAIGDLLVLQKDGSLPILSPNEAFYFKKSLNNSRHVNKLAEYDALRVINHGSQEFSPFNDVDSEVDFAGAFEPVWNPDDQGNHSMTVSYKLGTRELIRQEEVYYLGGGLASPAGITKHSLTIPEGHVAFVDITSELPESRNSDGVKTLMMISSTTEYDEEAFSFGRRLHEMSESEFYDMLFPNPSHSLKFDNNQSNKQQDESEIFSFYIGVMR